MSTENQKQSLIQIVGKSLPMMSVFLIIIGYIKTYLFYNTFQIDITNYISITDLPFIIPPDLIFLIPIIIFMSVPLAYIYKSGENINLIGKEETEKNITFTKKEVKFFYFVSLLLGIMFIISIYKIITTDDSTERLAYFFNIAAVSASIWFFKLTIVSTNNNNPSKKMWVILAIALILLMPSLRLISNSRRVKMGYYNGTMAITKTDTIRTSKNFIYVGSTSSHAFFYDKIHKSHTIIPNSEIIKLEIHQRKYPDQIEKYFKNDTSQSDTIKKHPLIQNKDTTKAVTNAK